MMQVSSFNEDQEGGTVVKRLSVPVGLEELMTGLTNEVLQKKPKDIYSFASDHFAKLLALRDKGNYQQPPSQSITYASKDTMENLLKPTNGPSTKLSRQVSIRADSPNRKNGTKIKRSATPKHENSNEGKIDKKRPSRSRRQTPGSKSKFDNLEPVTQDALKVLSKKQSLSRKKSKTDSENTSKRCSSEEGEKKKQQSRDSSLKKKHSGKKDPEGNSKELKDKKNGQEKLKKKKKEEKTEKAVKSPILGLQHSGEIHDILVPEKSEHQDKIIVKTPSIEESTTGIKDGRLTVTPPKILKSTQSSPDGYDLPLTLIVPDLATSKLNPEKSSETKEDLETGEIVSAAKDEDDTSSKKYDPSALREELQKVEKETKLNNYTSSYNPYILKQEIRNASKEDEEVDKGKQSSEEDPSKDGKGADQEKEESHGKEDIHELIGDATVQQPQISVQSENNKLQLLHELTAVSEGSTTGSVEATSLENKEIPEEDSLGEDKLEKSSKSPESVSLELQHSGELHDQVLPKEADGEENARGEIKNLEKPPETSTVLQSTSGLQHSGELHDQLVPKESTEDKKITPEEKSPVDLKSTSGLQHSGELHDQILPINKEDPKGETKEEKTPTLEELHDNLITKQTDGDIKLPSAEEPKSLEKLNGVINEKAKHFAEDSEKDLKSGNVERPIQDRKKSASIGESISQAASKIQAGVRGYLTRKLYKNKSSPEKTKDSTKLSDEELHEALTQLDNIPVPSESPHTSRHKRETSPIDLHGIRIEDSPGKKDKLSRSKTIHGLDSGKSYIPSFSKSFSVTDSALSKTLDEDDEKMNYSSADSVSLEQTEDLGIASEKSSALLSDTTLKNAEEEKVLEEPLTLEHSGELHDSLVGKESEVGHGEIEGSNDQRKGTNEEQLEVENGKIEQDIKKAVSKPNEEEIKKEDLKHTEELRGLLLPKKEQESFEAAEDVKDLKADVDQAHGKLVEDISHELKEDKALVKDVLQHSGEHHDVLIPKEVKETVEDVKDLKTDVDQAHGKLLEDISHELQEDKALVKDVLQHSGELHDVLIPKEVKETVEDVKDLQADVDQAHGKLVKDISHELQEDKALVKDVLQHSGEHHDVLIAKEVKETVEDVKDLKADVEHAHGKLAEDISHELQDDKALVKDVLQHSGEHHDVLIPKEVKGTVEDVKDLKADVDQAHGKLVKDISHELQEDKALVKDVLQHSGEHHDVLIPKEVKGTVEDVKDLKADVDQAHGKLVEDISHELQEDKALVKDVLQHSGEHHDVLIPKEVKGTVEDVKDLKADVDQAHGKLVEDISHELQEDKALVKDVLQHSGELHDVLIPKDVKETVEDVKDLKADVDQGHGKLAEDIAHELQNNKALVKDVLQHSGEHHDVRIPKEVKETVEDVKDLKADVEHAHGKLAEDISHELQDDKALVKDVLQHSGEHHDVLIPKEVKGTVEDVKDLKADVDQAHGKLVDDIPHELQEDKAMVKDVLQHSGEHHDGLIPKEVKETIEDVKDLKADVDDAHGKLVEDISHELQEDKAVVNDVLQHSGELHDVLIPKEVKETVKDVKDLKADVDQAHGKLVEDISHELQEDKALVKDVLQHSGELHDVLIPKEVKETVKDVKDLKADVDQAHGKLVEDISHELQEDKALVKDVLQHSGELHDVLIPKEVKETVEDVKDLKADVDQAHGKLVEDISHELQEDKAVVNDVLQHSGELHDVLIPKEVKETVKDVKDLKADVDQAHGKLVEDISHELEEDKALVKDVLQHSGELHDVLIPKEVKETVKDVKDLKADVDQAHGKLVEDISHELQNDKALVKDALQHSGELHDVLIPKEMKETVEDVKDLKADVDRAHGKLAEDISHELQEDKALVKDVLQHNGEHHDVLIPKEVKETAEDVKDLKADVDEVHGKLAEDISHELQDDKALVKDVLQHSGEHHDVLIPKGVKETIGDVKDLKSDDDQAHGKLVEDISHELQEDKALVKDVLQHSVEHHDVLIPKEVKETVEDVKDLKADVDQAHGMLVVDISHELQGDKALVKHVLQHSGEHHDVLIPKEVKETVVDVKDLKADVDQAHGKFTEDLSHELHEDKVLVKDVLQHSGEHHDVLFPKEVKETVVDVKDLKADVDHAHGKLTEDISHELQNDKALVRNVLQHSGEHHDVLIPNEVKETVEDVKDLKAEVEETPQEIKDVKNTETASGKLSEDISQLTRNFLHHEQSHQEVKENIDTSGKLPKERTQSLQENQALLQHSEELQGPLIPKGTENTFQNKEESAQKNKELRDPLIPKEVKEVSQTLREKEIKDDSVGGLQHTGEVHDLVIPKSEVEDSVDGQVTKITEPALNEQEKDSKKSAGEKPDDTKKDSPSLKNQIDQNYSKDSTKEDLISKSGLQHSGELHDLLIPQAEVGLKAQIEEEDKEETKPEVEEEIKSKSPHTTSAKPKPEGSIHSGQMHDILIPQENVNETSINKEDNTGEVLEDNSTSQESPKMENLTSVLDDHQTSSKSPTPSKDADVQIGLQHSGELHDILIGEETKKEDEGKNDDSKPFGLNQVQNVEVAKVEYSGNENSLNQPCTPSVLAESSELEEGEAMSSPSFDLQHNILRRSSEIENKSPLQSADVLTTLKTDAPVPANARSEESELAAHGTHKSLSKHSPEDLHDKIDPHDVKIKESNEDVSSQKVPSHEEENFVVSIYPNLKKEEESQPTTKEDIVETKKEDLKEAEKELTQTEKDTKKKNEEIETVHDIKEVESQILQDAEVDKISEGIHQEKPLDPSKCSATLDTDTKKEEEDVSEREKESEIVKKAGKKRSDNKVLDDKIKKEAKKEKDQKEVVVEDPSKLTDGEEVIKKELPEEQTPEVAQIPMEEAKNKSFDITKLQEEIKEAEKKEKEDKSKENVPEDKIIFLSSKIADGEASPIVEEDKKPKNSFDMSKLHAELEGAGKEFENEDIEAPTDNCDGIEKNPEKAQGLGIINQEKSFEDPLGDEIRTKGGSEKGTKDDETLSSKPIKDEEKMKSRSAIDEEEIAPEVDTQSKSFDVLKLRSELEEVGKQAEDHKDENSKKIETNIKENNKGQEVLLNNNVEEPTKLKSVDGLEGKGSVTDKDAADEDIAKAVKGKQKPKQESTDSKLIESTMDDEHKQELKLDDKKENMGEEIGEDKTKPAHHLEQITAIVDDKDKETSNEEDNELISPSTKHVEELSKLELVKPISAKHLKSTEHKPAIVKGNGKEDDDLKSPAIEAVKELIKPNSAKARSAKTKSVKHAGSMDNKGKQAHVGATGKEEDELKSPSNEAVEELIKLESAKPRSAKPKSAKHAAPTDDKDKQVQGIEQEEKELKSPPNEIVEATTKTESAKARSAKPKSAKHAEPTGDKEKPAQGIEKKEKELKSPPSEAVEVTTKPESAKARSAKTRSAKPKSAKHAESTDDKGQPASVVGPGKPNDEIKSPPNEIVEATTKPESAKARSAKPKSAKHAESTDDKEKQAQGIEKEEKELKSPPNEIVEATTKPESAKARSAKPKSAKHAESTDDKEKQAQGIEKEEKELKSPPNEIVEATTKPESAKARSAKPKSAKHAESTDDKEKQAQGIEKEEKELKSPPNEIVEATTKPESAKARSAKPKSAKHTQPTDDKHKTASVEDAGKANDEIKSPPNETVEATTKPESAKARSAKPKSAKHTQPTDDKAKPASVVDAGKVKDEIKSPPNETVEATTKPESAKARSAKPKSAKHTQPTDDKAKPASVVDAGKVKDEIKSPPNETVEATTKPESAKARSAKPKSAKHTQPTDDKDKTASVEDAGKANDEIKSPPNETVEATTKPESAKARSAKPKSAKHAELTDDKEKQAQGIEKEEKELKSPPNEIVEATTKPESTKARSAKPKSAKHTQPTDDKAKPASVVDAGKVKDEIKSPPNEIVEATTKPESAKARSAKPKSAKHTQPTDDKAKPASVVDAGKVKDEIKSPPNETVEATTKPESAKARSAKPKSAKHTQPTDDKDKTASVEDAGKANDEIKSPPNETVEATTKPESAKARSAKPKSAKHAELTDDKEKQAQGIEKEEKELKSPPNEIVEATTKPESTKARSAKPKSAKHTQPTDDKAKPASVVDAGKVKDEIKSPPNEIVEATTKPESAKARLAKPKSAKHTQPTDDKAKPASVVDAGKVKDEIKSPPNETVEATTKPESAKARSAKPKSAKHTQPTDDKDKPVSVEDAGKVKDEIKSPPNETVEATTKPESAKARSAKPKSAKHAELTDDKEKQAQGIEKEEKELKSPPNEIVEATTKPESAKARSAKPKSAKHAELTDDKEKQAQGIEKEEKELKSPPNEIVEATTKPELAKARSAKPKSAKHTQPTDDKDKTASVEDAGKANDEKKSPPNETVEGMTKSESAKARLAKPKSAKHTQPTDDKDKPVSVEDAGKVKDEIKSPPNETVEATTKPESAKARLAKPKSAKHTQPTDDKDKPVSVEDAGKVKDEIKSPPNETVEATTKPESAKARSAKPKSAKHAELTDDKEKQAQGIEKEEKELKSPPNEIVEATTKPESAKARSAKPKSAKHAELTDDKEKQAQGIEKEEKELKSPPNEIVEATTKPESAKARSAKPKTAKHAELTDDKEKQAQGIEKEEKELKSPPNEIVEATTKPESAKARLAKPKSAKHTQPTDDKAKPASVVDAGKVKDEIKSPPNETVEGMTKSESAKARLAKPKSAKHTQPTDDKDKTASVEDAGKANDEIKSPPNEIVEATTKPKSAKHAEPTDDEDKPAFVVDAGKVKDEIKSPSNETVEVTTKPESAKVRSARPKSAKHGEPTDDKDKPAPVLDAGTADDEIKSPPNEMVEGLVKPESANARSAKPKSAKHAEPTDDEDKPASVVDSGKVNDEIKSPSNETVKVTTKPESAKARSAKPRSAKPKSAALTDDKDKPASVEDAGKANDEIKSPPNETVESTTKSKSAKHAEPTADKDKPAPVLDAGKATDEIKSPSNETVEATTKPESEKARSAKSKSAKTKSAKSKSKKHVEPFDRQASLDTTKKEDVEELTTPESVKPKSTKIKTAKRKSAKHSELFDDKDRKASVGDIGKEDEELKSPLIENVEESIKPESAKARSAKTKLTKHAEPINDKDTAAQDTEKEDKELKPFSNEEMETKPESAKPKSAKTKSAKSKSRKHSELIEDKNKPVLVVDTGKEDDELKSPSTKAAAELMTPKAAKAKSAKGKSTKSKSAKRKSSKDAEGITITTDDKDKQATGEDSLKQDDEIKSLSYKEMKESAKHKPNENVPNNEVTPLQNPDLNSQKSLQNESSAKVYETVPTTPVTSDITPNIIPNVNIQNPSENLHNKQTEDIEQIIKPNIISDEKILNVKHVNDGKQELGSTFKGKENSPKKIVLSIEEPLNNEETKREDNKLKIEEVDERPGSITSITSTDSVDTVIAVLPHEQRLRSLSNSSEESKTETIVENKTKHEDETEENIGKEEKGTEGVIEENIKNLPKMKESPEDGRLSKDSKDVSSIEEKIHEGIEENAGLEAAQKKIPQSDQVKGERSLKSSEEHSSSPRDLKKELIDDVKMEEAPPGDMLKNIQQTSSHGAATTIQSSYRGYRVRRDLRRNSLNTPQEELKSSDVEKKNKGIKMEATLKGITSAHASLNFQEPKEMEEKKEESAKIDTPSSISIDQGGVISSNQSSNEELNKKTEDSSHSPKSPKPTIPNDLQKSVATGKNEETSRPSTTTSSSEELSKQKSVAAESEKSGSPIPEIKKQTSEENIEEITPHMIATAPPLHLLDPEDDYDIWTADDSFYDDFAASADHYKNATAPPITLLEDTNEHIIPRTQEHLSQSNSVDAQISAPAAIIGKELSPSKKIEEKMQQSSTESEESSDLTKKAENIPKNHNEKETSTKSKPKATKNVKTVPSVPKSLDIVAAQKEKQTPIEDPLKESSISSDPHGSILVPALNLNQDEELPKGIKLKTNEEESNSEDQIPSPISEEDNFSNPKYDLVEGAVSPRVHREVDGAVPKALGVILDQQLAITAPKAEDKQTNKSEAPQYIHIPLKGPLDEITPVDISKPTEASISGLQHSGEIHDTVSIPLLNLKKEEVGAGVKPDDQDEDFDDFSSSKYDLVEDGVCPRIRKEEDGTVPKALGTILDQQLAITTPRAEEKREDGVKGEGPEYIYIPLKESEETPVGLEHSGEFHDAIVMPSKAKKQKEEKLKKEEKHPEKSGQIEPPHEQDQEEWDSSKYDLLEGGTRPSRIRKEQEGTVPKVLGTVVDQQLAITAPLGKPKEEKKNLVDPKYIHIPLKDSENEIQVEDLHKPLPSQEKKIQDGFEEKASSMPLQENVLIHEQHFSKLSNSKEKMDAVQGNENQEPPSVLSQEKHLGKEFHSPKDEQLTTNGDHITNGFLEKEEENKRKQKEVNKQSTGSQSNKPEDHQNNSAILSLPLEETSKGSSEDLTVEDHSSSLSPGSSSLDVTSILHHKEPSVEKTLIAQLSPIQGQNFLDQTNKGAEFQIISPSTSSLSLNPQDHQNVGLHLRFSPSPTQEGRSKSSPNSETDSSSPRRGTLNYGREDRSIQSESPPIVIQSTQINDNTMPLAVQLNQAPAGAAVLTSPTPNDDDDDAGEAFGAHASGKGVSTKVAAGKNRAHFRTSMETDKRKNATIKEKNMEADAATKIQASFRGYQVRKQLKLKNGGVESVRRSLRRKSSGKLRGSDKVSQKALSKPSDLEEKSATKIQAGIRGFLVRRRQQKKAKNNTTPESS